MHLSTLCAYSRSNGCKVCSQFCADSSFEWQISCYFATLESRMAPINISITESDEIESGQESAEMLAELPSFFHIRHLTTSGLAIEGS